MSDNEEYEEGEEELEEDEAREEEEEDEEGGSERGAKKRRVFAEVLPEPKEAVDSLMLLLPGKGSTKVEVMVRLSETRRSFEKAYAPALRRLKRTNILAQLNEANDVDGLKEFLTREREAEEEGEVEEEEDYEDDDEDDVSEGGTKPPPPPYWLPALLANDTFYLERILSTMYGWVIEPPSRVDPTLESIHAAEHPGLNEEEEGEERGEEEGEEHEEEEEEDEEDDYMGLGPKTKKTKRPFPPPSSVSANLAAETTGVYPDAPVESEGEPTTPHRRVGTAGPDASGSLTEVPQRTGGDVDGVKGDASHVQLMPVGEDAEDGAGTPPRNENLISTEDIGISQDDDLDGSPLARGRAASVDGVLAPAKSIATISHGRSSVSMHAFPPLTTIPAFPDVNYTFFIVWEVRAEEWHLLDMHPLLWVLRFKQDRERRQELRRERRAARDEEREANNHNDEEDDEEEEDEEEGEEEEEEDEEGGGNASLPSYDMSSIIVVDAFMLAALQSTTALRWTLLAKEQPPLLDHLQRWMELDMHAGFPILSSIYSALLNIRSKDVFRLSYRIHRLRLDFNLFFTSEYVFSLSSKRLLGSERNAVMEPADKEIDDIASHRSAHGRTLMQSLLKAGISATRPIELRKLDSLESVQLLLWLLMVMPKSELLEWGKMALRSRPDAVNGVAIEEEEEEEEDEEEGSITESLLKMRIKKMKRNDDKDYAATQAEGLQPGPLLLHTILEIRRRIAREKVGKAPSQHTLEMHLGENYRPELIEDGKPRGDALVTSSFILGVTAITTTSGKASRASFSASQSSTPVSVNMDDALTDSCNRIVRHQKLYQSDLVLLLLALTSTLLPRRLQKSLSQIENPHSAAEDARVMVRRVNRSSGSSSDAHADLFKAILAIKLNKIRSPLERVRSGTLRLLFLTLPRFRQTDTMQHLCDVTPLYEVLGVNERCPLPELVLAWSTERKDIHQHYLDIFVNTFWHELHYRMEDGLYEPNTIFLIKTRLIALLEKVKERFGQYQYVLSLLTGGIGAQSHKRLGSAPAGAAASTTAATAAGSGRPGRTPRSVRGMSLVEIGADLASQIISRSSPPTIRLPSPRPFSASVKNTSMASVLHRHPSPPHFTASNNASSAPITVSHPSPYSIDFLKEVARVRAVFESLPMSARSYYIPETLHALLFKNPRIDPVIIRFVMVEQQVCTVRENPFQRSEVPVLEETIRTHNFAATKMVVGLGAPMTDLVDEGTLTLGALAEQTFDASEMEVLRQLWSFNESTMASDPAVQYSVLRMVGCGS